MGFYGFVVIVIMKQSLSLSSVFCFYYSVLAEEKNKHIEVHGKTIRQVKRLKTECELRQPN